MTTLRTTILLLALLLGTTAVAESKVGKTAPLFSSDDTLDVTIRAPISSIMRKRSVDEDTPATLTYDDAEEGEVTVDLEIRTRGRFRRLRTTCDWAPLRLNFKKKSVKNTLFEKSNKLKLVTHCKKTSRYFQALQSEYIAYRILNFVTDNSFRVRMLRVTYVDTGKNDREYTAYAFLIEHKEQVAKRIGLDVNDIPRSSIPSLDGPHINLTSVFQYLIGNTDFSPVRAPAGQSCCHNYVLFGADEGSILPIPYDFDMAGIVDAPHSAPSTNFDIRDVTERLYRGRCYNNEHVATSVQAFIDSKPLIYDLIDSNEVYATRSRKVNRRFLDDFYRLIEDPQRVQSELVGECIGRPKPASQTES